MTPWFEALKTRLVCWLKGHRFEQPILNTTAPCLRCGRTVPLVSEDEW